MTAPEAIRFHFAGCPFGEPCSEAEIRRAESMLNGPIPGPLRELYLAFDGFHGPALASFFWPLFATAACPSLGLVDYNTDMREDSVSGFPPFVSGSLFFGGNERMWGIKTDSPDHIIEWNPWDDGFKIVGRTPLEVWLAEKKCYDELDNDRNA